MNNGVATVVPEPNRDWRFDDLPEVASPTRDEPGAALTQAPRRLIEFFAPSELRGFNPPDGWNLVGDYHFQRGGVTLIGGPPGCGKSRALTGLAVAGATGQPWFGLTVHRRFKTMILQAENGRVRLRDEYAELTDPRLDEFVRVCAPPPLGFAFDNKEFVSQLRAMVEEFRPDVFAIDPWNRLAADEKAADYRRAYDAVLSVLPAETCLAVVCHTRKPAVGERAAGRGLLNTLAGSYVLGSAARAAFVLMPASDDPEDDRTVLSCCKNNDGLLGARSAWRRRNGLFAPVADFDFEVFDNPESGRGCPPKITVDHLIEVFEGGAVSLTRAAATRKLEGLTGARRTQCYEALRPAGRFAGHLVDQGGVLSWKP